MDKILVCDDEENIRKVIKKYAEYKDNLVYEAINGLEAITLSKKINFDIIIMDIMMPEMDGYEALKEIRKFSDIPVLMLSAKSEDYDKILGFELGVDDYVTKPFSNKEIMLRIEAILKRYGKSKKIEDKGFSYKGVLVDLDGYKVTVDGIEKKMALKEYELLFYLIRNKNIVVSRDKLLSEVWGYDFYGDDRTIDTHIKTLRKDLGPYSDLIVTVRGIGYRLDDEN